MLQRYGLKEIWEAARSAVRQTARTARPRARWMKRKSKAWRTLAAAAEAQKYELSFGSNGYGGLYAEGVPVRLHLPRRRLAYTKAYRVCIADPAALNVIQLPTGALRFLLPEHAAKPSWELVAANAVAQRWPTRHTLRAFKKSADARKRST